MRIIIFLLLAVAFFGCSKKCLTKHESMCDSSCKMSKFDNDDCISLSLTNTDSVQSVHFPSLFSPNGNGINDIFLLRVKGVKSICVTIKYKKDIMFQLSSITSGWDGSKGGAAQDEGIYTVKAKGTYNDGTTFDKTEQLLLIRTCINSDVVSCVTSGIQWDGVFFDKGMPLSETVCK